MTIRALAKKIRRLEMLIDQDESQLAGVPDPQERKKGSGDARTTTLDDLNPKAHRVFGYLFDFGDEWYHQVQVERIEQASYSDRHLPARHQAVGKSPPQYAEE